MKAVKRNKICEEGAHKSYSCKAYLLLTMRCVDIEMYFSPCFNLVELSTCKENIFAGGVMCLLPPKGSRIGDVTVRTRV